MNFYNINLDLFLSVRIIFEKNLANIVLTDIDFGVMDLTPYFNIYFIFSALFSVVCFLLLFWNLKKNKSSDKNTRKKKIKSAWETFKEFIIYHFYTYFKENYRKPNFFEYFSKFIIYIYLNINLILYSNFY